MINTMSLISTTLLNMLADTMVINIFVAIIGIGFTKAVSFSYENAVVRRKMNRKLKFSINLVTIMIVSFMAIFIFSNIKKFLEFIQYEAMVTIVSWSISVIAYDTVIKSLFQLLETLLNKLKDLRLVSECEMEESKTRLLTAKTLNIELIKELELKKQIDGYNI